MGKPLIILSAPGPSFSAEAERAHLHATAGHDVLFMNSGSSAWDGFNRHWVEALNRVPEGVTHFAQLHSDIIPDLDPPWLDVLFDELTRLDADMVSVAMPVKDGRGLVSCGIGDTIDPWHPRKVLTLDEVCALPVDTFDAGDLGCPGWPLLHNTGCWIADLRRPCFHKTNADGSLAVFFDFPRRVVKDPATGQWLVGGISEDWNFSLKLFAAGARTFITRKVRAVHWGSCPWPNYKSPT